jgi:hypothetical protein
MHPPQEARSITKRRRLVDSNADGKTIPGAAGGRVQRGRSASVRATERGAGSALGRGDQVKIDDIA